MKATSCSNQSARLRRVETATALFSMIAVVPTDKVKVTANGQKLKCRRSTKTISATPAGVGVHMHGPSQIRSMHSTADSRERLEQDGWAAPASTRSFSRSSRRDQAGRL